MASVKETFNRITRTYQPLSSWTSWVISAIILIQEFPNTQRSLRRFVNHTEKLHAGVSPLVGCPQNVIQYIYLSN